MASKTEICNRALAAIGQDEILTLDDSSKAARCCRVFYDPVRRRLQRKHSWVFALCTTTAPKVGAAVNQDFLFQYQKPNDCLRLVRVADGRVAYNLEGSYIYSNDDPLVIRYVQDIQDPNLFDDSFTECLVILLATALIAPLGCDITREQYYDKKFEAALAEARHINAIEQNTPELFEGDWVPARG